ncbi:MAG TPA: NAD(P)/FAD-dependent oxidoreductase [Longimicrobiaceae bacterium]
MNADRPRVVIVGGGFGGLYAARALRNAPVQVTVIDRRNYHLFQPLLYQVATAALSPADIAAPIRQILHKQRNTEVLLAEVTDIDTENRLIRVEDGRTKSYDYLILATGSVDQYFGHDEWARTAPGLKAVDDATEIRRRFLLAFEAAEQEPDPQRRAALLTFVVIGGGATGVEMAGAFAELARHTLARDFRRIDPTQARVVLLEGGPRLLPAYPDELSQKAKEQLERLGVEVRLNAMVTNIDFEGVWVGDERIETRTVVWGAGVKASPLGHKLGVPTDRMGRVFVEPDLSIPGHPEVFVIGDLANFSHQTGEPLPGVAQVAMQQARTAAENILRTMRDQPRLEFRYKDKGMMATIGRAAAVAVIGGRKLSGLIAWLAWLFVHIVFLIGFRNRVLVLLQWAWAYLTWQRSARLITGDLAPKLAAPGQIQGETAERELRARAAVLAERGADKG